MHILIFERSTEEESVLTLSKLFVSANIRTTLFISHTIYSLIKDQLDHPGEKFATVVFDNQQDKNVESLLSQVSSYVHQNEVDIVLFTRFECKDVKEFIAFSQFVRTHRVCSLIESRERWLSWYPPVRFNKYYIPMRSAIRDWIYCRRIFPEFDSYFISEVNVDSHNPLKTALLRTNKYVFEFPFKVSKTPYNPLVDHGRVVFTIPGRIDVERRDYNIVLDILGTDEMLSYSWELILLGRVFDERSKSIARRAEVINRRAKEKRISYFTDYIARATYEELMEQATHIIAPVKSKAYAFGKDSGAIYDVLKYNKIGIFDRSYFYSPDQGDEKLVLTYRTRRDLKKIIGDIVKRRMDYSKLISDIRVHASGFTFSRYSDYVKNQLSSLNSIKVQ